MIQINLGLKRLALALTVAISAGVLAITPAAAQNQLMEQKLMAIKQAQDTNKQKLAQYTWTETETISIKGNVKDTKTYQVQIVRLVVCLARPSNIPLSPSSRLSIAR